jgi:hypothetical protein
VSLHRYPLLHNERQELSTRYRQRLDDFRGERCRYFRYLGDTSI